MNQRTYESLCAHLRETALLHSIAELLEWDERTKMPVAAGAFRADQIAYLSGQVHRRRTDPRLGDWLLELEASSLVEDPHSDAGATIRQCRRHFDKLVKVPASLVEDLTRTAVLGQQAWVEARRNNDFPRFVPLLKRIIGLKREQAEAVGYPRCPYDALLDDYEPGETTENVARILGGLREELVLLAAAVAQSGRSPNGDILRRRYPQAAQEEFARQAVSAIGFDFQRGRLDVTHHPFCSEMGPDDCRITTRYDEHFFPTAFFRDVARSRARPLRPGPAQGAVRVASRYVRLAGDPRVAVPDVGEFCGAQRAILAEFFSAGPADVSRGAGRRVARAVLLRD
jgi:carboxypeptidase Taq